MGMGPYAPIKPGSSGHPVPGYDVRVMSEQSQAELGANVTGELVLRQPLPPGTLPHLYQREDLYVKTYLDKYPGFYQLGDSGHIDEEGYVFIMERTGEWTR